MKQVNNNEQFGFAIKRIKDFSFLINEGLFVPEPGKMVKIGLQNKFGFNSEQNIVDNTFKVFYHYEGSAEDQILAEIQVQNVFEILDLPRYINTNGVLILPKELITAIVTLSLSHTRALLYKNLSGTVYQDSVMPIMNAEEVAKNFFPYMFVDNSKPIRGAAIGSVHH